MLAKIKSVWISGTIAEFLQAVAEAEAGPAAGTERDHGLLRLQRRAARMRLGMQPRGNAPHAHRVVQQGKGQRRRAATSNRKQNEPPANARDQQHRAADGGQQNGLPAIRFDENQTQHRPR